MKKNTKHVSEVETQTGAEKYPANIRHLFEGRHKAKLGDQFDLTQFGVNFTTLEPGCVSALRHWHEGEDEFVYVVSGMLTLVDDDGEHDLVVGSFVGFPAGHENGHMIVNRSSEPASFIEVGSRMPGNDVVHYPDHAMDPVRR